MGKRNRRPNAPAERKIQGGRPWADPQLGLTLEQRLEAIADARRQVAAVTSARDELVRAARENGATWADLAAALEVTPQAVQKRFSGSLPA